MQKEMSKLNLCGDRVLLSVLLYLIIYFGSKILLYSTLDLQLVILLCQPPGSLDYGYVATQQASF